MPRSIKRNGFWLGVAIGCAALTGIWYSTLATGLETRAFVSDRTLGYGEWLTLSNHFFTLNYVSCCGQFKNQGLYIRQGSDVIFVSLCWSARYQRCRLWWSDATTTRESGWLS